MALVSPRVTPEAVVRRISDNHLVAMGRGILEAYSRAGGTHHSTLVLGGHAAALAEFGRMRGLEVVLL